jgi:hypothetical protein
VNSPSAITGAFSLAASGDAPKVRASTPKAATRRASEKDDE